MNRLALRSQQTLHYSGMRGLILHLTLGARTWRHRRGQAFLILATLASALALATSFYSLLHSIILKQFPYPEPQNLGFIWTTVLEQGLFQERGGFANFSDLREMNQSFQEMAAFDSYSATLSDGQSARQIEVTRVSQSFFDLMGADFILGRPFDTAEFQSSTPIVVISERLWAGYLGRAASVLNQELEIDGQRRWIVGVVSRSFQFPGHSTQAWEPASLDPNWADNRLQRGTASWRIVARLRDEVGLEGVRPDLDRLASLLVQKDQANQGLGLRFVPLDQQIVGPSLGRTLWLLFGAVLALLLIAAANVAGLFSAQQLVRSDAYTLRSALGATPRALWLLRLGEIGSLIVASCPLALAASLPLTELLKWMAPATTPRLESVSIPAVTIPFCLVLSLLLGAIVFLSQGRSLLSESLDGLGRKTRSASLSSATSSRLNWLMTGQVALLLMLLWGSGLIIRSLINVLDVDPGYQTQGLTLAQIALSRNVPSPQRAALLTEILLEVNSLPGLQAAAINDFFSGQSPDQLVTSERGPFAGRQQRLNMSLDAVSPGYFDLVGSPLEQGREFSVSDNILAPRAVVINRRMASYLWPENPAVGERIRFGRFDNAPWLTVVGVVSDSRRRGLDAAPIAQAFVPHAQSPNRLMNLLVRSSSSLPTDRLASLLRARVADVNSRIPVYRVERLAEALTRGQDMRHFAAGLLSLFAAASLGLAGLGLHGLLSLRLAVQLREIGVRKALGANRRHVVTALLRRSGAWMGAGIGCGALGCVLLGGLFNNLLYEVELGDGFTLLLTATALIGAGLIAAAPATNRALRSHPADILRRN